MGSAQGDRPNEQVHVSTGPLEDHFRVPRSSLKNGVNRIAERLVVQMRQCELETELPDCEKVL